MITATAGRCSLSYDMDSATMVGPTGVHKIYRSGDSIQTWKIRVKAHWGGFLMNQDISPLPGRNPKLPAVLNTLKEFNVHLRYQHPAWDEHAGINYTITADSKQMAIKFAKTQAEKDGHFPHIGGGQTYFKATEIESD